MLLPNRAGNGGFFEMEKEKVITWKEAQESEAYKNADVVVFIDQDGNELPDEVVKELPDDVAVILRRSYEVAEVEVQAKRVSPVVKMVQRLQNVQDEAGMTTLDYEEPILLNKVPEIADALDYLHVRRFTLSNPQTSMQDIIAGFEEKGWELKGLVKITNRQAVSGEVYSEVCEKTKNTFLLCKKD